MTLAPIGRDDVFRTILPVLSRTPLRMTDPPLTRFTLPVAGAPEPTVETVTINPTDCPTELGSTELAKLTDGTALVTAWVNVAEDPPTKLGFPPKTATRE